MPSYKKLQKGVVPVAILILGFLVVSLAVITATTNNPIKTQIIETFAKDKEERKQERHDKQQKERGEKEGKREKSWQDYSDPKTRINKMYSEFRELLKRRVGSKYEFSDEFIKKMIEKCGFRYCVFDVD